MDIPQSTVREPLKFFEWIFEERNYHEYKHDFFINYDKQYQNVTFTKDKISYWNDVSSDYEDINFGVEFQKTLNRKLKLSKKRIDESISTILFNANTPVPFLSYLQATITEIKQSVSLIMNYYPYSKENDATLIINDYPYVNKILDELEEYVENKLILINTDTISDEKSPFYYNGKKAALENMKKFLEDEKHFINSTDDFIAIFTQKPFKTKINWIKNKNALHYFIDGISTCERMKFEREEKWIITAKCFTYDWQNIDNSDIKANNKTPKKLIINILEKAIQML